MDNRNATRHWAVEWSLKGPWGNVESANITPDKTGISYYNENLFIEAMRTGSVMGRPLNPIMPWDTYRHMSDEDFKCDLRSSAKGEAG